MRANVTERWSHSAPFIHSLEPHSVGVNVKPSDVLANGRVVCVDAMNATIPAQSDPIEALVDGPLNVDRISAFRSIVCDCRLKVQLSAPDSS